MRCGVVMGAGESAMVAASGSRSAMRMAMAAPIEWPSSIVVLGSSCPLCIRDSTAAVAQSCACAKENASRLSPWPGKSIAYARNPWPAKSSARYIINRRFAESPCSRTTLPAGFTSAGGSRTVIGVWQPPASSHSSCLGSSATRIQREPSARNTTPTTARMICQSFIGRSATYARAMIE